ncbi:MAG: cohesin domain-containing protein [Gracilimonas sp.]|uniref:cohesin domain-containing protein n=1 Tax=Gracilimonas sp. TaxID=1974203 RepID=UPI00375058FD|nr:cohesin domain-containing protein [Gracilimonas sp.]
MRNRAGDIIKIIILSGFLLVVYSCGQLEVDIEVVNLFDPADADYSNPETEVLDWPAAGLTIDSTSAVFTWRHSDPNYHYDPTHEVDYAERIFYRYRLNTSIWSPWYSGEELLQQDLGFWTFDTLTGLHVLQLDYLEDIDYNFEVMSKYPTNIREDEWPNISFMVDAFEGVELLISPGQVFADSGTVFYVNAKLIDVTDFMGIHLDVSYDNSFMQLQNYALESDSTDFLLQSAGHLINFIDNDTENGRFQLDLGVAGGAVTGVSGTGNIVRLIFEHTGSRGQSVISISSESMVRDVYNNSVIEHIFSGVVSVW